MYIYRNSKSIFMQLWPVYTFTSHFMSYLFKNNFFYHEHALLLLNDRRKGGRGCHRERGREEERERKRGEGGGGREGKIKQPNNQPTNGGYLTIWLLPIRKWFCWKDHINPHHRKKTISESESLLMITKRSFSGEHSFNVFQFLKKRDLAVDSTNSLHLNILFPQIENKKNISLQVSYKLP